MKSKYKSVMKLILLSLDVIKCVFDGMYSKWNDLEQIYVYFFGNGSVSLDLAWLVLPLAFGSGVIAPSEC